LRGSFRKVLMVVVVLVVMVAGVRFARTALRDSRDPGADANRYSTAEVTTGRVHVTVSGTGSVEASSRDSAVATVGGTVTGVYFARGEGVKEGQLLLELDDSDLRSQLEQSRIDLEMAEMELSGMQNPDFDLPSDAEIRAAELEVDQARMNLEDLRQQAADLTVVAPSDGIVEQWQVDPGDSVAPGQPLVTMMSPELDITISVAQNQLDDVDIGFSAEIRGDAFSGHLDGTVIDIGSVGTPANRSATFPVTVELDPGQSLGQLREGMVVSVYIKGSGISANGTVARVWREVVSAPLAGNAGNLRVRENGAARQGQVLIELLDENLPHWIRQAENQVTLAQERLANLQAVPEVYTADQIRRQELTVAKLRLNTASLEGRLDDYRIYAPVNGICAVQAPRPGSFINAGMSVATILDPTGLEISIDIDELDIGRLGLGQEALVSLDAIPGATFSATVTEMPLEGLVNQGITVYPVGLTLHLEGDDLEQQGVLVGMSATVTIAVASSDDEALVVPVEALHQVGGDYRVRVLTATGPEERGVEIGLISETSAEVLSGLTLGDRVVTGIVEDDTQSNGPFGRR